MPRELEEAALIDGATHWQVFTKVMLPHRLARHPDRGADHRALFVERVPDRHDLPAEGRTSSPPWSSFFLLSGQYSSDWGEIMAAALIIVLPVVILFVALQRRFIEGMAGGSVKG